MAFSKEVISKYRVRYEHLGLKPLEKYKGSRVHIDFQCLTCNDVRKIRPQQLLVMETSCKCQGYKTVEKTNATKLANNTKKYMEIFKEKGVKPLESYVGYKTKMQFECLSCGDIYTSTPDYVKANTHPCPKCANKNTPRHNKVSQAEYDAKLLKKYKGRIKRTGELVGMMRHCEHTCTKHGKFIRTPQDLLSSPKGCKACNIIYRGKCIKQSLEQVTQRLQDRHGDEITLVSKLKGIDKRHKFKCSKDHTWVTTLDSVLRGSRCPKCTMGAAYSQAQLKWLNLWREGRNLKIQAADWPCGEKRLQGKSGQWWKVDGWCKDKNLVFEFDGDIYQGNPKVFKPHEHCNPFSTKTAKELLAHTVRKWKDLRKAGYDIIRVWEADFNRGLIASNVNVSKYEFKLI